MKYQLLVFTDKNRMELYFSMYEKVRNAATWLLAACVPLSVHINEHVEGRGYTNTLYVQNNEESL